MLILLSLIAGIVGIVVWAIMSIPPNVDDTSASVNAINNVYHWLGSKLGPNWPYVLSVIITLLIIILGLVVMDTSSITIDENVGNMIVKFIAVLTTGVAALITWQWRRNYIQNPSTEYYVELTIICLLLAVNGYLLYRG